MGATTKNHTTRRLSRSQIVALIERGAKERRGMSAEELIERYRSGTLDDPAEVADILGVAGLLNEDDPLFVAP